MVFLGSNEVKISKIFGVLFNFNIAWRFLDKQLKDWEKITKSLTDNYILPSIKSHITENIDNLNPEKLPISKSLKQSLSLWECEYESHSFQW
jgi:hypothetical protein